MDMLTRVGIKLDNLYLVVGLTLFVTKGLVVTLRYKSSNNFPRLKQYIEFLL